MATDKKRLVIGVTGPISGGKGTVVDLLKAKGYFCTSLSDRIREEITARGEEITREKLQDVADELRVKFGANVLAERTWQAVMNQPKSAVIDSIRNVGEVEFLKQKPGFILIGVSAPRELRFKRMKERTRTRSGEPLSWEEFVRLDKKDFDSGIGDFGRNIQACLDHSDFLIENTGTLEELKAKVEKILKRVSKESYGKCRV